MPVEIKELHIRVVVADSPAEGAKPGGNAAAPRGGEPSAAAAKDEIVAECVEQVLQILQAKKER